MDRCDFSSIMTCLKNHISESNQMSQPEFLYEVFEDFMDSPESKDFSLDNGLVCRWMTGFVSIWSIAGTILLYAIRSTSCPGSKFDTPIARILPSSYLGKPNNPKIKIGSKIKFVIEAADRVSKNKDDFPMAITKQSKIHCPICPKENSIQIVIYCRPYLAMTSFPSDCQAKYCLTNSKHEIEIRIHAQIPIKIEASAALRTLSGRFSPSALEMAAFSPIAFPKPSAEIII